MQEILLKVRYFERGSSKSLKKGNFIFSFKPSPFQQTKLSKTKGAWNWPVDIQVTKQIQKNSIIRYVLSDQVWWCNIKQFLSFLKIVSANLCKPIYDIINCSTSICPSESGKCGKKITKIWISWERKELFRWNKKHFSYFLKAYHSMKK